MKDLQMAAAWLVLIAALMVADLPQLNVL